MVRSPERERRRGARSAWSHHESGAYVAGSSHHALRAAQVNQNPADFARTMFELRSGNTANFHFRPKRRNVECRFATRRPSSIRAKVKIGGDIISFARTFFEKQSRND